MFRLNELLTAQGFASRIGKYLTWLEFEGYENGKQNFSLLLLLPWRVTETQSYTMFDP